MSEIQALFTTGMQLMAVILGFSAIICLHEAGHFLAARWAGIRVLAFAVGFGPAVVSFRKGLGVRFGGSESEYNTRLEDGTGADISPTEYRWNWVPFGGYVKMLGQEDLNPDAVSEEPDSYQNCVVWKRMVVISAGVVMNLITGAILFVAVFMAGLETEPPSVGPVDPGTPAGLVRAENAERLGIEIPGLLGGDRVIDINGRKPRSFNDLALASMIAKRDHPVRLLVEREGVPEPLEFLVTPEMNAFRGQRGIGIWPARSARLFEPDTPEQLEVVRDRLDSLGWNDVEPGMVLARVGDRTSIHSADALTRAVRESGGLPVEAEFRGERGSAVVQIQPEAQLEVHLASVDEDQFFRLDHLLGLTPVMRVGLASERGQAQGLRDGDVFVQAGDVRYPSVPQGISEIRKHAGRAIDLVIQRSSTEGTETVRLSADVSSDGLIGFLPTDTSRDSLLLAGPPEELTNISGDADVSVVARALDFAPGARIASVDGTEVADFAELRAILQGATQAGFRGGDSSATVAVGILPDAGSTDPQTVRWTLSRDDMRRLHNLGWSANVGLALFPRAQIVLKAGGPLEAMTMGFAETRRLVLLTYVTFARLFEGTVKVEQLKGPIGIAHLGTLVAERGAIWLMFFMGMISVNLAVINFLPLPIVDGGQFLFLLFEQVRGRPVPVKIQNAATLAGLVLIASLFLFITYNDIVGLFKGP